MFRSDQRRWVVRGPARDPSRRGSASDRPVTPQTASTSARSAANVPASIAARIAAISCQRPGHVVQADAGATPSARRPGRGGGGSRGSAGRTPRTGSRRRAARRSSACRAALTWSLPVDVSAVPWRPSRVCITQSNWSTPSADGLDQRRRVADAHQVAGPVGGQVRRAPRRAPAASRPGSRPPRARRCRSRRSRARRCGAALSARSAVVDAALHDAEQRLVRRGGGRPGPALAHAAGALDGEPDDVGRARQRRADVEHHLDVGAEQLLRGDGRLGREAVRRAVVGALERDAVVVDLRARARTPGSRRSR